MLYECINCHLHLLIGSWYGTENVLGEIFCKVNHVGGRSKWQIWGHDNPRHARDMTKDVNVMSSRFNKSLLIEFHRGTSSATADHNRMRNLPT